MKSMGDYIYGFLVKSEFFQTYLTNYSITEVWKEKQAFLKYG